MTELIALRIITNGSPLVISGDGEFYVTQLSGLYMAPINRLTERAAQQHGETDYGFLLDPRQFSVVVEIDADLDTFWPLREQLLIQLAPYNSPSLEATLPDGSMRQIDFNVVGQITAGTNEMQGFTQAVGLALRAPDPSWYGPTAVDVNFGVSGGGSGMTVPTPVPTSIGASTADQTIGVAYAGTWYSFPTFRITGPMTDPVIENETTGEKLDFTGTTIANGDWYDIDTRYGRKSVVDSSGVNKIADLTDDSDLGTFHLEPAGAIAPSGNNSLRISGSAVTAVTAAQMTYFNRYLGI